MYNIIQLTSKDLGELQEIANEMGIKGIKSLERQDLIYRILDEQAIVGAQKRVAADEDKNDRRQRTRINKKEVANKVYSADKDKAEKINDTPKIVATPIAQEQQATDAVANEPQTADNAPKKRGRKPKGQQEPDKVATEQKQSQPAQTAERSNAKDADGQQTEDAANAPKKRGRKPKGQQGTGNAAAQQEQGQPTGTAEHTDEANGQQAAGNQQTPGTELPADDFVAVEQLPSEGATLPSELVDKFEQTKLDKQQPQQGQGKKRKNKQEHTQQPLHLQP